MTDEPYAVDDREFAAVVALPASKRYEHFVKRVADTDSAYILADDDHPVVLADERGEEPSQLPLWPHPRYADAYRAEFGGADRERVDLDELLDELLPAMADDGVDVAVFPTPDGRGVVVPAGRLRDDLLAYLDDWYGGR